jgi:hypothetical protein
MGLDIATMILERQVKHKKVNLCLPGLIAATCLVIAIAVLPTHAQSSDETRADGHIPIISDIFKAISSAATAPNGKKESYTFSNWMSGEDYQDYVENQKSNERFPILVEGRSHNGKNIFRGLFVPYLSVEGFGFWTHHGLTRKEVDARESELEKKGYRSLTETLFKSASGWLIQGTWLTKASFFEGRRVMAKIEAQRLVPGEKFSDHAKYGRTTYASFSADGQRFVTMGYPSSTAVISLWDATEDDPEKMGEVSFRGGLSGLGFDDGFAISADGSLYAAVMEYGQKSGLQVAIRDWQGNQHLTINIPISNRRMMDRMFAPEKNRNASLACGLAFSPDSTRLAVCHKRDIGQEYSVSDLVRDDDVVDIYDVKTGNRLASSTLFLKRWKEKGKQGLVTLNYDGRMRFSPSGRYLVVPGMVTLMRLGSRWEREVWSRNVWVLDARTLKVAQDFGVKKLRGVANRKEYDKALDMLAMPRKLGFGNDNLFLVYRRGRGYGIETIDGSMRTEPIACCVNPREDMNIVFNKNRSMMADMVWNKKEKIAFIKFFSLTGKTLSHITDHKIKSPIGIAQMPDQQLMVVNPTSVVRVPWPSKNNILAIGQKKEGMELIKANFKKEGLELLAKSMTTDISLWKRKDWRLDLFYLLKWIDSGERGLEPPDLAKLSLILLELSSDRSTRANAYIFYGTLALKAGHPALARQAAARIKESYPKSKAATLIDAGAIALNGDADGAYQFLLKNVDRKGDNGRMVRLIRAAPNAFKPLLEDRRKLAFVLGQEEKRLPNPAVGTVKRRYPDLNGNLITPAGAISARAQKSKPTLKTKTSQKRQKGRILD